MIPVSLGETMLETVRGLSQSAAAAMVAAAWQGAVLAAGVWLGLRALPKTPAAVRFAIWFAVFAVVMCLPFIDGAGGVSWLQANAGGVAGGRRAWMTVDARWCVALMGLWAAASLWRAGELVVGAVRLRRLWARASRVEELCAQGSEASGRAGLRCVEVCVSDEVDRPSVIGFFAPKILIPRWLLEKLTAAELAQVVLHERQHLDRADDWMNLLQKLALVVFPLNPALVWVERRLCFERELACDERVLAATGAPKAYAACLASVAEHRLGRRGFALELALGFRGALGRESELGRRVRRILDRRETMRAGRARLVLAGAMVCLLAGVTELVRCPRLVAFSDGTPKMAVAELVSVPVRPAVRGFAAETVGYRVPVAANGASGMTQSGRSPRSLHALSLREAHTAKAEVEGTPGKLLIVDGDEFLRPAHRFATVQWVVVRYRADIEREPMPEDVPVRRYAAVPAGDGWLIFQM